MDVSLNSHNQDDFLNQFPLGSFLQGRFWRYFLDLQGVKSWQLNVYDNNRLVAHCLLYTTKLAFGKSYLYSPKGPLFVPGLTDDEHKEALELILSQIRDITIATRRREEIFCRLEPNRPPPEILGIPARRTEAVQPQTTLYLTLDKPADELFASFKEKTRYNIRLAERKDMTVHWSRDETGLSHLLKLLNGTRARQGMKTHPTRHYRFLLKAGMRFNNVEIAYAERAGTVMAANLYITTPTTMTYLHGGFSYAHRELMAPYLLHWHALQRALEQNLQYYDFWGIAPENGSRPAWAGFTRFKLGFGGTVADSPGAFDFIYNPFWYNIYERARNAVRSLRQ